MEREKNTRSSTRLLLTRCSTRRPKHKQILRMKKYSSCKTKHIIRNIKTNNSHKDHTLKKRRTENIQRTHNLKTKQTAKTRTQIPRKRHLLTKKKKNNQNQARFHKQFHQWGNKGTDHNERREGGREREKEDTQTNTFHWDESSHWPLCSPWLCFNTRELARVQPSCRGWEKGRRWEGGGGGK